MTLPTPGATVGRLACFKAYDVRGVVPDDLDDGLAYRIGRAYAREVQPSGPVAIGRDVRLSSPGLAASLIQGLNDAGVSTRDIGLCGTEVVYFAAARPGMGGGIMVTASHNPREYNGMKLVRAGAVPVLDDTGLDAIEARVRQGDPGSPVAQRGENHSEDVVGSYVEKVLSFVDVSRLRPLRIVANSGNGCAGPYLDALAEKLPFDMVRVQHEPDGAFPNGVPNPLLPENQTSTTDAVVAAGADMGIAWDGDFDRCFFFDETGRFVDGYYVVGLLAEATLSKHPNEVIVHDGRQTWNTIQVVRALGGSCAVSRTGHGFFKQKMRAVDAVYGGELSAHHYFRDFSYCDSGMIPWLVMAELICRQGRPLSEIVSSRQAEFPCSGELNSVVNDTAAAIEVVRARFAGQATSVDWLDGLSMEFGDAWRFNVRPSVTEPILRLNVEAREDATLLRERTAEILELVRGEAIGED